MHRARGAILLPLLSLAGCLPYTVGTTAATVERGETTRTISHYFIPDAVELLGDSVSSALYGMDMEVRYGLDDRSDVGVRIPSGSGLVVNYKRRLGAPYTKGASGLAFVSGAGIVNWGEHAHLEASLLASGRESARATVYGGLRVMQVIPISSGAPHDSPTAGGFLGVRIGTADRGFSPEIGVFYDRSTLDLRRTSVIFVPAVSFHGDILRGFGRGERGGGGEPTHRPRPIPRSPGWPRSD